MRLRERERVKVRQIFEHGQSYLGDINSSSASGLIYKTMAPFEHIKAVRQRAAEIGRDPAVKRHLDGPGSIAPSLNCY